MVRAPGWVIAVALTASVVASAAGPVAAHGVHGDHEHTVGVAPDHSFAWFWLDDYASNKRFFSKSSWSGDGLPPIVVQTLPGRVRPVILQFRQGGTWNTEAIVPTNTSGVALLTLDPYCENGSWCDGLYDYRIKVGAQVVHLVIQYSDDLDARP